MGAQGLRDQPGADREVFVVGPGQGLAVGEGVLQGDGMGWGWRWMHIAEGWGIVNYQLSIGRALLGRPMSVAGRTRIVKKI